MTTAKPIRQTKKLTALLKQYEVQQRRENPVVVHAMTRKATVCDPLTFAVWEAAIKAVYVSNALHPLFPEEHRQWYRTIAARHGFSLLEPPSVGESEREKHGVSAANDYGYCCQLITQAGLYFELLD